MIHKIIKPSEILRPYIRDYHVMESDGPDKFLPKRRIYTYGCVVLVFHYSQPSLFKERNKSAYIEPRTVICGPQTNYYDLSLAGKTGMILVIFQPYGAGMFFKMPINEIVNQNIAFELHVKKGAKEIEDKILHAQSIQDRIKLIDDFLLEKFIQNNRNSDQIVAAFAALHHEQEQITVKQMAASSRLSIKQFERKFPAFVGLSPKQYLRIARFQKIIQLRNSEHFENYTSLAYDCGYYDQSHFIHDFKMITDLSPKEFFQNKNSHP